MTTDQQELIAKTLADFRAQIMDLTALKQTATGYVVKVGPLWIAFNMPGYKNPRACGVQQATVLATHGEAYRIGKWVQNGGGTRGVPQRTVEAIDEQIESLEQSIAFLSQQFPQSA
jgi:hypothetical protein